MMRVREKKHGPCQITTLNNSFYIWVSVVSGTNLKANTKMKTDVEQVRACIIRFHPFTLFPSPLFLHWINITKPEQRWENESENALVKVANSAVVQ